MTVQLTDLVWFSGQYRRILGAWWQVHCKRGASARGTLDREPAAVSVEDVLDQREAQTGTALRTAVGHVDPVKAFREPRQMFGCNARAVITYRQEYLRLAATRLSAHQRNVEPLAGRPVFQGIFHQVLERSDQFVAVAEHDHRVWRGGHIEFDAPVACEHLQAVDDLAHDRHQVDRRVRLQMRVELDARK